MKKKKTLNQTWTLCLRMWRWIAKVWNDGDVTVWILKEQWLKENGFTEEHLFNACFFCDFQEDIGRCIRCPGKLVDSYFSCNNPSYGYEHKPIEFYKELLRLNRIRKGKK